MSPFPTPPSSREVSGASEEIEKSASSTKHLVQSLDSLLERYLHLLDRHQTLQANLGKQLSSVLISYDTILDSGSHP
jgi:coiled-coil domain-containing protein 115